MLSLIISILIAMPPNPFAKVAFREPRKPKLMDEGGRLIPKPTGEKKALILLVDFPDNVATYTPADFDSLIYGANQRSMRDYYSEVSYGKFTISRSSRVIGWLRMPHDYSYYIGDSFGFYPGNYPYSVQGLVMDACALADPLVNFAEFDENSDGIVDAIFIVHAGPGAEETGQKNMIWSHQWQLSNTGTGCPGAYQSSDGVAVDFYSMEPERLVSPAVRITCGVFVHEFGHQLNLPDLYDRDYSTNGLGWFCLMAGGSWGRASSSDPPGSSPTHLCAWAKYQLGWVMPQAVERTGVTRLENHSLAASAASPAAVRLMEDPGGPDWEDNGSFGEYFLVENRYRTGFDRGLPGDGLLILHCDDTRRSVSGEQNDNERHPLVGIMQADGDESCLLKGTWGTAADLWKDDSAGFGQSSTPASWDYQQNPTGVTVYQISGAGPSMTASFWIAPVLFGRVAAYPNPFRADRLPSWGQKVVITYYPSDTTELGNQYPDFKVSIYNLAGERVRVLDSPDEVDPLRRSAYWDLTNDRHDRIVSGMYLYVIETTSGNIQRTRGRMTVIR